MHVVGYVSVRLALLSRLHFHTKLSRKMAALEPRRVVTAAIFSLSPCVCHWDRVVQRRSSVLRDSILCEPGKTSTDSLFRSSVRHSGWFCLYLRDTCSIFHPEWHYTSHHSGMVLPYLRYTDHYPTGTEPHGIQTDTCSSNPSCILDQTADKFHRSCTDWDRTRRLQRVV